MSELNITLEHQPPTFPVTPTPSAPSNNNRYVDEDVDVANRHQVSLQQHHPQPQQQQQANLRPAVSNHSVHKSFVQDDMVLINNARGSALMASQSLSAARSVNDLDHLEQMPMGPGTNFGNATLPAYRAAPDYETAMRNKLSLAQQHMQQQQQQQQQQHFLQNQATIAQQQSKLITDILPNQQTSNTMPFQEEYNLHLANAQQNLQQTQVGGGQPVTPQQQHPASSLYSTSTPELNRINMTYHQQPYNQMSLMSQQQQVPTQDQIVAELQRLNLYKPPPPYPGLSSNGQHMHHQANSQNNAQNRMISSTSTPDLASSNNIMTALNATHTGVPGGGTVGSPGAVLGGSSPDLVSRKNLGLIANSNKSTLHKTMENLHQFMENHQKYNDASLDDVDTPNNYGAFPHQVSYKMLVPIWELIKSLSHSNSLQNCDTFSFRTRDTPSPN